MIVNGQQIEPGYGPSCDPSQPAPPGCEGQCAGVESMCFEPQGSVKQVNWKFVGEGKGGYSKVQTYNFVGTGGAYEQQQTATNYTKNVKTAGKGLLVLLLVAGMAYYLTAPSGLTTTTTSSPGAQLQQAPQAA